MTKEEFDEPRCTHPAMLYRVTNIAGGHAPVGRPHRSTWVCGKPACVRDAQEWVEDGTGEKALILDHDGNEVEL